MYAFVSYGRNYLRTAFCEQFFSIMNDYTFPF